MRSYRGHAPKAIPRDGGFSLLELVVAMGIFILVGASALVLFSRQQTNANMQQGMVGLNIGIRNATAQLQLDLANAASGNYVFNNVPIWPIGVTVVNNVVTAGTSCYTPPTSGGYGTYGTNCFDQLNILEPDPNVPPILMTDSTGAAGVQNLPSTTGGVAYGQAASGYTLQQTAGFYPAGSQLLLLKSDGSKMTTVVLTAAPTVYNSVAVQFNFDGTNSDGSNYTPGTNFNYGSTTVPNDPLDITACGGGVTSCPTTPNIFTTSFNGNDWIFKLAPVIYYVNSSNASDPQLIRVKGGTPAVIMDQVIGFKVGATIWNSVHNDITWGTSYYFYNASQYNINNPVNPVTGLASSPDSPFLFYLIRAVRVSLIGRTQPSSDPTFTFANAFDKGPYYVQGASVVVSPRNLSMND
jgi:type II secretory pathway pseudopilin PulG